MSGGGGGIIIIRNGAKSIATTETVTANLTPAECAERDEILGKLVTDWTHKDLVKLFAIIAKASRRCG